MSDKRSRIVSNWILVGIVMLVVQVLLGGITRLTGSGLSITEWKPIMGALPPLSEQDWQSAFTKYQQIAQYKYLNTHFSLTDFKFIFFWEWFHRLWARLIGVVFLVPFIYFIAKKYIAKWMLAPLVILFVLGALQGAVGWLMVKSGLNENDLYVSHIRLAAHFIAAMILIAYALIFWIKLKVDQRERVASASLKNASIAILALLIVQLIYGAFMAGLKAAAVASTWPTINGDWLPANAFSNNLTTDLFHNKITIHFIHRNLAYLVTVLIVVWWWASRRGVYTRPFKFARNTTMVLVLVQVLLGILAVLNSQNITPGKFGAFEWMAQLHQLTGMLLFLSLTAVVYLTTWKRAPVSAARHAAMPLV